MSLTTMTLEPSIAAAFIAGYKALLLEIAGPRRAKATQGVLELMASGRSRLIEKPGLLDGALARLRGRSELPSDEVVRAVRTLQVENWVFLRNTKAYSIFVHPSGQSAFGVLGLTDPVSEVVCASNVAIETGIVRLAGRFVCDGLLTRVVHLGSNYRKSFNGAYRMAKSEGRFHVCDEA